jgi:hypothetical protein
MSILRQLLCVVLVGCVGICACADDVVVPESSESPPTVSEDPSLDFLRIAPDRSYEARARSAPEGTVEITLGSSTVELWPWTGSDLDGTRVDPVNVIFVGHADPLRIRAALLELDGDRTAFGFPNAYPFNSTWSDAMGDVQTSWTSDTGWTGSVIQLQLGVYEPMRFHLRLFPTLSPLGDGRIWTVAGVHMDVKIPGTADHAVVSWERPREILVADMMRTGLLDPSQPYMMTGPITDTPHYREIIPPIYNGLPESLKDYLHCPPGPTTTPVPIPNDGMAVVLSLASTGAVEPGHWEARQTMVYDQVIPKPLCSEGPLDYVLVRGPVDFVRTTSVDRGGRFTYHYRYSGTLTIVPVDVTVSPPVPRGDPYLADVQGAQHGMLHPEWFSIQSRDQRVADTAGGAQMLSMQLMVRSRGTSDYRVRSICPNLAF